LKVDGAEGIQDVAGEEDRAVPARDEGELGYLGVDELPEAGEQLDGFGCEPVGDLLPELAEVGLEITRELE